jgi:methionyl-tRNA formyltransferase
MPPIRTVFFGTADLACASLEALIGFPPVSVVSVVTRPDRPRGRHLKVSPSPVKALALTRGLAVLQPEKARDADFVRQLADLRPELVVVAAYGQILPRTLLDVPRLGCLNVHASLLPKYRGAAPIQWALLNGDPESGVTIMKMDPGLDTGDILTQDVTAITPDDDAISLHNRLASLGANLLIKTIPDYAAGRIVPRRQPAEGAVYAPKITREDGRLDWNQPARALWNRIRALVPWPGTFVFVNADSKPQMLKIWRADVSGTERGTPGEVLRVDKSGVVVACGQDALRLRVLQREGGKRLTAAEYLAGHPIVPGERLV